MNRLIVQITFFFLIESIAFANIYSEATRLFRQGRFAQSAAKYYISYNRRIQVKKSEWGLTSSLYKLGLHYSASKYLSYIIKKGPDNNTYFRKAFDGLGNINYRTNLGQSHIVQLFRFSISPADIPGSARGFYFYYKGIEEFSRTKYNSAISYFNRVQSGSKYYLKSLFHIGVIENLKGNPKKAIQGLNRIKNLSSSFQDGKILQEQANLNIARIKYEQEKFKEAIYYYSLIPRNSDNWLQAIFESAWGFYIINKGGNVLGNIHTIHSPFFKNRFFPESYILQAITFLRYCRYDDVKETLKIFKSRYSPVLKNIKRLIENYRKNPKGVFNLVNQYKNGKLTKFRSLAPVFDALSRSDTFKQAEHTISTANSEIAQLSRAPAQWKSIGLVKSLKDFINKKKLAAIYDSGQRLHRQSIGHYKYLIELSDQTRMITAELLLGKVDNLRSNLNLNTVNKKGAFIGGMKELKVGQDLEVWPFNGEYWEDELGGYVFNIPSLCKVSKKYKSKSK